MLALKDYLQNMLPLALQESLVGLLRLILFIILFILVLLLKVWEWLRWLLHTKNLVEEETKEEDCGSVPDPLIRRPDPCIYSQSLLLAQGLPVTWDNPDIWMAPASNPGAIEPDSYHLQDDTDYLVSVQVHNASTDPAINVKVRLVYRPWSFNSPDVTPVELDANGQEAFRFADIPAMGAAIVQFRWHTPSVAPGETAHYCLQVQLSHPMDTNTANNVGQENTNVYSQNPGFVSPGEMAEIDVPLFNTRRQAQTVRFRWDAYQIKMDDKVELRLKAAHGRPRMPLSNRVGHWLPTVAAPEREPAPEPPPPPIESAATRPPPSRRPFGRVVFASSKSNLRATKTRYEGFEALRQQILSRDYSLPAEMTVTVEETAMLLEAQSDRTPKFRIQVPSDAAPDTRLPVNIIAEDEAGGFIGGVTVYFHVRP
jgi:hypothetical protein